MKVPDKDIISTPNFDQQDNEKTISVRDEGKNEQRNTLTRVRRQLQAWVHWDAGLSESSFCNKSERSSLRYLNGPAANKRAESYHKFERHLTADE